MDDNIMNEMDEEIERQYREFINREREPLSREELIKRFLIRNRRMDKHAEKVRASIQRFHESMKLEEQQKLQQRNRWWPFW